MKQLLLSFLFLLFFVSIKSQNTLLWSNDMSTAGDWTITNTSVPSTYEWYHQDGSNLSTPAASGDFASTTASNGFFMVNSAAAAGNADGNGTPIVTDVTITAPIDLSATNTVTSQAEMFVTLTFEHNFSYWYDIREVHVSGDGGANWTVFPISNASGNLTGAMQSNSGNPEVTTVNISSVAGGSNNVLVRFHYDDQDLWTWYWVVDDIKINVQDANDLAEVTSYFGSNGLPYYSIPTSQIAPIDFYSVVSNAGAADQTNSIVTVDVNAGTFTGTSAGMTLAQGATDTLNVTAQYTPAAAVGSHAITYSISAALSDDNPADNVAIDSFAVTNYIYARDRGVYEGQGGGEDVATTGDFAFEAGNDFQIFADQQAFGIDVVIGTGTPSGTIIYGKIYEWVGSYYNYLDETFEYIVTSNDVLNNANITLPLFTAPTLNAGSKYLVVVGCYYEFYFGESGYSPNQTSFILYGGLNGPGGQYYTNNTPMVRLNFEPCSSSSSIAETVCDTYTAPSGAVYSSTGIYTDTILNAVFCDSVITIDLTVNYSSSLTLNETACGSYTLNNQTYTSSGTFTQTLTNAVGCDSTINLVLTILSPYPLAFQANPTAGTTPLNVIFDNQTPNLSNYNFTWSFGDGTVMQDNGSFVSHTYQSDGTWDVMLIAEDITTGCTDTLFNNGYIFSTGGTPCGHAATITQSGPITACLSDSIFLSCNTDPNFTYQWQLNGFPIGGATASTYYPSQAGSYMVVITDNNCPVFSSTIQVTINTFNAPTISGTGSISSCTGGSITLSVPDDYISYLWSSGGTDTSEVVTSSGDYTVTVTNSVGCEATSSIYSVNASLIPTQEICIVTVDSASAHNLVVWEKPIVAGIDSFIVYREMGTNNYMPIGSVAYDSLSQFVDTANGINPNVTSYRYKVSILDTCGTESNLSYYHETMHLSINQGIGGEVNLIWDEYEGFPIVYYYILRDSTANGNWEVLDSVSSNNFIYTDLNPPVSGVNYVIEVLPPNICTSTKAQDHNSTRSNRVIVNGGGAAPVTDFISSATQIVSGSSIDFSDESLNDPTTWSWNFYGATPSASTAQNPTNIIYNNVGLYDVRLIVGNANGIDTLIKANYIEVSSSGGAAPTSGFVASATQISEGSSINFLDQSQNNPTSWTWLFDGGNPAFSNDQLPTGIVYNAVGIYDVTLVTSNSSGIDTLIKEAYINVTASTLITENGVSNLSIYPNPTSDQITIDIKGYYGDVNVEVYDLQGRLLETTTNTKVSLKKHAKGIYVLKVSYGEITEEVRVVRE